MTTRGFFLFATSHPYFGRLAANLASTIKAADPTAKISVATDNIGLNHLNESEMNLFDKIITPHGMGEGLSGVQAARLQLPYLTPYDETIAVDADMLWLPKAQPSDIFGLLNNERDFTIVNEGFTDLDAQVSALDKARKNPLAYTHWADAMDVKNAYDLRGKLYKVRGEFIVFRRTDNVEHLFKTAAAIQQEPAVDVTTLGGGIPEEFALNIALNLCGIEPHADFWEPAYWPALHGNFIPQPYKLKGYAAISFGGNSVARQSQKFYDQIAAAAASKNDIKYRFPLQPKRHYLPERRKM